MSNPFQSRDFYSWPIDVKMEGFSGPNALIKREIHHMEILPLQQPVEHLNRWKQKSQIVQGSEAAEFEDGDDVTYLTGEHPFFNVMLAKSHVSTQMQLPVKIVRELPKARVPVVLRSSGKNWDMFYVGDSTAPRFSPEWLNFVTDNNLKAGDACVFELKENSSTKIKFRVVILRNELPPELLAKRDVIGTESEPIELD